MGGQITEVVTKRTPADASVNNQVEFQDRLSAQAAAAQQPAQTDFNLGTTTIQYSVSDENRVKEEFRQPAQAQAPEKKDSWFDRTWLGQIWNWFFS